MTDLGKIARKSIEEKGLPLIEEEKSRNPLYLSMRELQLRFRFGTAKIQKFFEGLKEGRIYMTQCVKCGKKFFPPQADCPDCLESKVAWHAMSGEGELLTCTMIFVKPPTYDHYNPYVVGVAQMKEGVRVLAWLKIDDPKDIKPKMKIHLATARREPEGFITYEFTPA